MLMPDNHLHWTSSEGVSVVTLNRPKSRNALSFDLRTLLRQTINQLDRESDVRAIVLTGADPAFCAGVDLRELDHPDRTVDLAAPGEPFFVSTTPVIGAINGAAYTGGLELALACHFRIASERALFADTHARMGFAPGRGLTVMLTDSVGSARARQIVLTGEPINAGTALAWGLVNEVVPHEQLLFRACGLAQRMASNDPHAMRRMSETLDSQAAARQSPGWQIEADAFMGTRPTALPAAPDCAYGSRPNERGHA
jgi:enoyl-CoA hydratase